MALVKLNYRNILDTASTIFVTSEDPLYPKTRLYDRDIGLLYKATSNPNPFYFLISQPASFYAVDTLIVPAGHNFDTLTMSIHYSDDNWATHDWTALSWTQSGNGQIVKTFASLNYQYFGLAIASPSAYPQMTELYLGPTYTFERSYLVGSKVGKKKNVIHEDWQKTKWREMQQYYSLNLIVDSTQKTNLQLWDSVTEGVKNFYFTDADGTTVTFMELTGDLIFNFKSYNASGPIWDCSFEMVEVLA